MPTTFDDIANAQFANYFSEPFLKTMPRIYRSNPQKKEEDMATKALPAPEGFKFGCDPECFIFRDGKPVSAAGLIPGTKAEPHRVKKGAVQVDGMAAEINPDPASDFNEWNGNIVAVIGQLEQMLPEGYELRWIPSVEFPEDEFAAAPDENKELGCQPDFDAWSGGVNPPPCPENPFIRCAGGHLHLSWTENEDLNSLQHLLNCQDIVKQFDFFLAAWSITKDEDKVRRILYGKMGACRYKHYGVEYRVLSNFWVNSRELRVQVWNRMVTAINEMNNIYLPDRLGESTLDLLRQSVNSNVMTPELGYALHYPVKTLNRSYNRW